LAKGPLKKAVVIQQLEPPEDLLLTARHERLKVIGA
jgi:hypothetical protein